MGDTRHDEGSNRDTARWETHQQLLIDLVLGRCNSDEAAKARALLESDDDFAAECEGLRRLFSALSAMPAAEPPDDLARRTMARVRAARTTESLLAAQRTKGVWGPRKFAPTFALRDLVALAAVTVLAAGILVPSLRQARRRADVALCAANVGQIGAGLSHFASSNNDCLPASPSASEADFERDTARLGAPSWLPAPGRPCASNTAGLFQLVRSQLAPPEVFQCPSAGGTSFDAAAVANLNDFPSPKTIDYSYQHSLSGPVRRCGETGKAACHMAILADATPVFVGGKFRADRLNRPVSDNHPEGVQNVLYLDMHVERATDARVGVNGNNIWLAEGIYDYCGNEKPASPLDTFLLPGPGR